MSEPTIYEVAKEAGVSAATVSRKLLGKRYLMHVQSWGFQHRKQPPCCERESQIV